MKININITFCVLFVLMPTMLTKDSPSEYSKLIYMGVFEPRVVKRYDYKKTVSKQRIRLLFFKDKRGWRSLKRSQTSNKLEIMRYTVPAPINLDIYDEGKIIGRVKVGKVDHCTSLSDCGIANILSLDGNLRSNKSKYEYATWQGLYEAKPMVVLSRLNKRKSNKKVVTNRWMKFKLSEKKMKSIKKIFIKRLKNDFKNCKDGDHDYRPREISEKNVDILESYRLNLKTYVYGLKLNIEYKCDGIWPDDFFPHWFHEDKKGIRLIGVHIKLIDMSDFDGDGQVEWLFQYEGYNNDGYTLFYDSFKKKVEFNWVYH